MQVTSINQSRRKFSDCDGNGATKGVVVFRGVVQNTARVTINVEL